MMMAESKPVLPSPSERHCACMCVCVRKGECWGWRGLENSKWRFTKCRRGNRSREKKKVVHKKLAVYLKKGRCLTNINVKADEEEIKPII